MAAVSHMKKVDFLSSIPFFESFAPAERDAIARVLSDCPGQPLPPDSGVGQF